MVLVILCGGSSTPSPLVLPRPLTPILGRPMLYHALKRIVEGDKDDPAPADSSSPASPLELLFIYYATPLRQHNFEEVVRNLFPRAACSFVCLDFSTRGPLETAVAGLTRAAFVPDDEPVTILDNDNVYPSSVARLSRCGVPFVGYDRSEDSGETSFSFVRLLVDGSEGDGKDEGQEGASMTMSTSADSPLGSPRPPPPSFPSSSWDARVLSVAEKARISDDFCCGIYGFARKDQFLSWARYTQQHGPRINNQVFISGVYANMLAGDPKGSVDGSAAGGRGVTGEGEPAGAPTRDGIQVMAKRVRIAQLGTQEARDAYALAMTGGAAAAVAGSAGDGASPSSCTSSSSVDPCFLPTHPNRLRVCFDLENVLVTPPATPGNLCSVRPVDAMVDSARRAKAQGHTVVIHTTRLPEPSDGAAATREALARLGIPCDEIHFGKPAADVYVVNERSACPYLGVGLSALGLPFAPAPYDTGVPNALPNNRYNTLRLDGVDRVAKRGPASSMRGELFFYQSATRLFPPSLAALFPTFHGHSEHFPVLRTPQSQTKAVVVPVASAGVSLTTPTKGTAGGGGEAGGDELPLSPTPSQSPPPPDAAFLELSLELIRGIPLYTLFQNRLLERYVLTSLFSALASLHSFEGVPITLTRASLTRHYLEKMRVRFGDARIYCYEDCVAGTAELMRRLEAYVAAGEGEEGGGGRPRRGLGSPVSVVHGDVWFSNALVTGGDEFKLLDMRGLVDGALTLNGDPVYDYAKVLQSLLGFDEALYQGGAGGGAGAELPPPQRVPLPYRLSLIRTLVSAVESASPRPVHAADVFDVSLCLMAGSLHAYEDEGTRGRIWRLVAGLLSPLPGSEEEAIVAVLNRGADGASA
jgi:hypothetical protein